MFRSSPLLSSILDQIWADGTGPKEGGQGKFQFGRSLEEDWGLALRAGKLLKVSS